MRSMHLLRSGKSAGAANPGAVSACISIKNVAINSRVASKSSPKDALSPERHGVCVFREYIDRHGGRAVISYVIRREIDYRIRSRGYKVSLSRSIICRTSLVSIAIYIRRGKVQRTISRIHCSLE